MTATQPSRTLMKEGSIPIIDVGSDDNGKLINEYFESFDRTKQTEDQNVTIEVGSSCVYLPLSSSISDRRID